MSTASNIVLNEQVNGTTCPYWMDSRDARCGSTTLIDGRWCKRHTTAMERYYAEKKAKEAARIQRDATASERRLPELRERLERVRAQIRRLDPPPPTDDPAAFMGVGSAPASRYRRRAAANVPRLAELWRQENDLAARVRRAEGALGIAAKANAEN